MPGGRNSSRPPKAPASADSTNSSRFAQTPNGSSSRSHDIPSSGASLNIGRSKEIGETSSEARTASLLTLARQYYKLGRYGDARNVCEQIYQTDAYRTDNLLLLGALHFQLRNFSEAIFYNQQAIRVDPHLAEAFGNLGNSLKELGDLDGAIQFYLKAIKLKPRFCDAYNNLASSYMQQGRTKEASETFQMSLILNPELVEAHSNLGNLHKAQGKLEEAKRCFLEAIRIRPDFAIAWSNLAGIFKDQGDLETAVAYYEESLRLSPDFADAWSNMGNALKEMGPSRLDDAERAFQTAIKLRPDFAIAHGNLGSCAYDKGNIKKAITSFKHALQLEPNFPDTHNNLGNALREQNKIDESISHYRAALRLKPDHPHAYNNLGNALKDKGLIKEAIHCYMTACRLMPRFAAAHSNMGSILKEQGKSQQAIAHYQQAIDIDPMFAGAYSNLGNAYKDMGRMEDAIKCFTTSIRLKPDFADAYSNLAGAYRDSHRVDDAITCYRKALSLRPDFPDAYCSLVFSLIHICDWRGRSAHIQKVEDLLDKQLNAPGTTPSMQPFHALMCETVSAEKEIALARCYADRAKRNTTLLQMPSFRFRARLPTEPIHIGYVGSNFNNHTIGHMLQIAVGLHNSKRCQVTCYSLSQDDLSEEHRRFRHSSPSFKDISQMGPGDAAQLIHSDKIHILIDLNGYSNGSKLEIFALKPAPIQISALGYPGTLGADFIDYKLVDPTSVPSKTSTRDRFVEKMLYMPYTFVCTDHHETANHIKDKNNCPTRAVFGIPEDKIVFGCFHQLFKIDPGKVYFFCGVQCLRGYLFSQPTYQVLICVFSFFPVVFFLIQF
jgi:protein O-GlcNAc transferase